MATVSPDQSKILEALINTASQTSAVLGLPLDITEKFIAAVDEFLLKNHDRLGDQPFLLALRPSESSAPHLTLQVVIENVNKGKPVLYVNEELRLLEPVSGSATLTESSVLTRRDNILGVLVSGTYAYELLQGVPVGEGHITAGRKALPVISKFHRPMEEFEAVLSDHLDECLNAGQLKIWSNKADRILMSEPEKTELIFHRSLFSWAKLFVSPKLKIYAEPTGLGQDKTDIIIVTSTGSYVIEVKWLGINQSGQEYKQDRIDVGLAQVKIYLEKDHQLVCGYLVCYDGRLREVHETESSWNDSLRHELCRDPQILFLSSEVPSVAAVAIAKGATR